MILNNNVVHIFTDGSCLGNPGPAGAGVIIYYNDIEYSLSKYLGNATNNIAELSAIELGLNNVNPNHHINIYTDSNYSIGILTKGWKVKANKFLITRIKNLLLNFKNIKFIKVKAHSNNIYNEKADLLAIKASSIKV